MASERSNPGADHPLPLAGKRILVTRAPHQASELVDRLVALGAAPVLIPTIEIGPPASFTALDAALETLTSFHLIAFTSANAVTAFAERAQLLQLKPTPRRIAAVGPATARALEKFGLRAQVLPPVFTAESLGQTLAPEALGKDILLVLAEGAPRVLELALTQAGAKITVAAAYANRIPASSLAAVTALFREPSHLPDAITFTSASTAANLMALLDAAGLKLPPSVMRASIGPITSRALAELGLAADVEAAESTIAGLVEALSAHLGRQ